MGINVIPARMPVSRAKDGDLPIPYGIKLRNVGCGFTSLWLDSGIRAGMTGFWGLAEVSC